MWLDESLYVISLGFEALFHLFHSREQIAV